MKQLHFEHYEHSYPHSYRHICKGNARDLILKQVYRWKLNIVWFLYVFVSWHLAPLYIFPCPQITPLPSHWTFSLSPLTALMLVCITVQHWLELSALSEQHLSCWSVECLYNSLLYEHEVRRDKKEESIKEGKIQKKRTRIKSERMSKSEEENERGEFKRGCKGGEGDEERRRMTEWVCERNREGRGEKGREREGQKNRPKNAWQGLSILRQMDNVGTVSCLLFS